MTDIINADRAAWAEAAIDTFMAQTGLDGVGDDAISDLIADIGHYCDANNIDYLATIRRAIGNWCAEKTDADDIQLMPAVAITIDGGAS